MNDFRLDGGVILTLMGYIPPPPTSRDGNQHSTHYLYFPSPYIFISISYINTIHIYISIPLPTPSLISKLYPFPLLYPRSCSSPWPHRLPHPSQTRLPSNCPLPLLQPLVFTVTLPRRQLSLLPPRMDYLYLLVLPRTLSSAMLELCPSSTPSRPSALG